MNQSGDADLEDERHGVVGGDPVDVVKLDARSLAAEGDGAAGLRRIPAEVIEPSTA